MGYLIIILVGFLLYFKTLFFDFTYLDDNVLILDNFYFIKNLANILAAFAHDAFLNTQATAYYRPLLTISFILNSQLSGTSAWGYHLVNVLLHLGASCLVFAFLKRLKYPCDQALFLTLIFTVHPVLTQAVAWIPGRNDSLLAIFVLSSFIFLFKFFEKSQTKDYFYHLLLFGLAILTKESALVIPMLALLYLWLMKKERIITPRLLLLFLGWLIILFFWFILRSFGLKNPLDYGFADVVSSVVRNLPATIQFLGKIVFPLNLTVLPTLKETTFSYGLFALLLLTILIFLTKDKQLNRLLIGFSWFLLFSIPNLIQLEASFSLYEHRIYLSLIGFLIVLAETKPLKIFSAKNKLHLLLALTIILILSSITFRQSEKFKNRMIFWQEAVTRSPSHPLAHRNLGVMYFLAGLTDKAEEEYKKSLALNPQEPMAHNNLGVIYLEKKLFAQAEEEFKKELAINPLYDRAYFNLGLVYYQQGNLNQAEKFWLKTIEINPNYLQAYENLVLLYQQKNDPFKANFYLKLIKQKFASLD